MDSAWIGAISALAGVSVASVVGLGRDFLSSRRQQKRDDVQRTHDAEERRYGVRRDAYVAFGAACWRVVTETDRFDYEHQGSLPGAMGFEGPHTTTAAPMELIYIIGPESLINAAVEAQFRLDDWAFGSGMRDTAVAAVEEYSKVSRAILKLDVE